LFQQIGIAATFNTEIAKKEQKYQLMKQELLLSRGFSPDLDLPRNPSWSRMWESFGEDALLKWGNG
jgi:beta-glucosidase